MNNDGLQELMERVREYAASDWHLGRTHGAPHWDRVARNGILLATDDTNIKVVLLFAYLHDKCRLSNRGDLEHGARAAELVAQLRNTLLQDLSDEEIRLLQEACRWHTVKHRTGNATIDVCFDADRLDLTRVGITPHPAKMATNKGQQYAAAPQLFLRDIEKLNRGAE